MLSCQKMKTMTRDEALADADREISRLIVEGRGLFYIAELYGVPVRRHQSRHFSSRDPAHLELPEYLQGQPGTLTLDYLREQLADLVVSIEATRQQDRPVRRLRPHSLDQGRDVGHAGQRPLHLRQRAMPLGRQRAAG